jgi:hypothetical protein
MRPKTHGPFDMKPREILASVPDIKAFKGRQFLVEGLLGEPFRVFAGLCCTNRLMVGVPLSPDRLIPRAL